MAADGQRKDPRCTSPMRWLLMIRPDCQPKQATTAGPVQRNEGMGRAREWPLTTCKTRRCRIQGQWVIGWLADGQLGCTGGLPVGAASQDRNRQDLPRGAG